MVFKIKFNNFNIGKYIMSNYSNRSNQLVAYNYIMFVIQLNSCLILLFYTKYFNLSYVITNKLRR